MNKHKIPKEDVNRMFKEAVKNYPELNYRKSITIRVKRINLIKLRAKAERNNIPYQTLINLLINSYTSGKTKLTL